MTTKRYGEQDWHLIAQGLQLLLEKQDVTIQRNQAIIESMKAELARVAKAYDLLQDEYEALVEQMKVAEEKLATLEAGGESIFSPAPVEGIVEASQTVSGFLDEHEVYSTDINALQFSIHYAQKAYRRMREGCVPFGNRPKHNGATLVPVDVLEAALKEYRHDVENGCVKGAAKPLFGAAE